MKDKFNRKIDYLRISVTDRCNLRCVYCMSEIGVYSLQHKDILSYEELYKIIGMFQKLGITKIRVTGGEPLVRKGIIEFLKTVKQKFPEIKLFITTNLYFNWGMIDELNEIGLSGINISFDTLKPETFNFITRIGDLNRLIDNIKNIKIKNRKFNTVILKNINESEIFELIEFAKKYKYKIRFIEKMDWTDFQCESVLNYDIKQRLIENNIINKNPNENDSSSLTEYYNTTDNKTEVGFISPISEPFCELCNRIRLTSNGKIKPCLFSENLVDIKPYLKNNNILYNKLKNILYNKPEFGNIKQGSKKMNFYGG